MQKSTTLSKRPTLEVTTDMTLYYDGDTDSVVENHPEYAEFDEEGRLVLNLDELDREEKRRSLLNAAAAAVDASDTYELTTEPEVEWTGGDD